MANYTKDDAMFQKIEKDGTGILVASAVEQKNGQTYRLVNGIDIDWNEAQLTYVYAATNTYVSDTSDLMHLIDEISHGNAIDWEVYAGEPNTQE